MNDKHQDAKGGAVPAVAAARLVTDMAPGELREEHRRLGARLLELREKRAIFEEGGRPPAGMAAAETDGLLARLDAEMAAIRTRQQELYAEFRRRGGEPPAD